MGRVRHYQHFTINSNGNLVRNIDRRLFTRDAVLQAIHISVEGNTDHENPGIFERWLKDRCGYTMADIPDRRKFLEQIAASDPSGYYDIILEMEAANMLKSRRDRHECPVKRANGEAGLCRTYPSWIKPQLAYSVTGIAVDQATTPNRRFSPKEIKQAIEANPDKARAIFERTINSRHSPSSVPMLQGFVDNARIDGKKDYLAFVSEMIEAGLLRGTNRGRKSMIKGED